MEKNITKIDNIKNLWKEINQKSKFMEIVANDLGKSKKTLRVYWFSNYGDWAVPDNHQDRVIELLQNTIKSQSSD